MLFYDQNIIYINVFFDNVKGLDVKEKDVICIVGKLNITGNIYDFENAHIITSSDIDSEKYYTSVIKKDGHYYFDYEFDNNIGLPISYTEIYFTFTMSGSKKNNQKNEKKHTLKYDNNKNLIEDKVVEFENEVQIADYIVTCKYNDDNTLATEEKTRNDYNSYGNATTTSTTTYTYQKNDKGEVTIENIETNGTAYKKPSTKEITYEYNEKGQVAKKIVTTPSLNDTTVITYEYNEKDQVVKENERSSWLNTNKTYTYEYDEKGNQITKAGDTNEYSQYGVVGIK